ncbi:MAG: hypothetical protein AAGA55_01525 [Planctomycetota bacterium]
MPAEIPDHTILLMRLVFAANILVAGYVGVFALFAPGAAESMVFQNTDTVGPAARVTGAFWIAIALASMIGLIAPAAMAPVLLIQLLYKGLWLAAVAAPALLADPRRPIPTAMAGFFLVWVAALPWVIPWKAMFVR